MSGFSEAMMAAMKRRLENTPAPTAAEQQQRAAEAQKKLGFGKEPPKTKVDE